MTIEKKKNTKNHSVADAEGPLGVWSLSISVYQWQGLRRVKQCFGNPFWPEGVVPRDSGVAAWVCLYLLTRLVFEARLCERSEAYTAKRQDGSHALRVLPVNHHQVEKTDEGNQWLLYKSLSSYLYTIYSSKCEWI